MDKPRDQPGRGKGLQENNEIEIHGSCPKGPSTNTTRTVGLKIGNNINTVCAKDSLREYLEPPRMGTPSDQNDDRVLSDGGAATPGAPSI